MNDHYIMKDHNKWRIVEIKKFSIGAGTTAVLVPKRLCLVVSSRSVRRQPEKLGRRWWKVWNKVLLGDRCRQSGVLVDQVYHSTLSAFCCNYICMCYRPNIQRPTNQPTAKVHRVLESMHYTQQEAGLLVCSSTHKKCRSKWIMQL